MPPKICISHQHTTVNDQWEIDVNEITHLYELRHAVNVLGFGAVVNGLGVNFRRVVILYNSCIHGSTDLTRLFMANDEDFKKLVREYELEATERELRIAAIEDSNEKLIAELKHKRKNFAGIGTNKAKRRLNKVSLTDPLAKVIRVALEIEDKSISAKNSYGTYREKIYRQKTKLILNLCDLFKEQGWTYGVQKSDVPPTTHVIYFEVPGCEQISWHFTPENDDAGFPAYTGEWDRKQNSTMGKIEVVAARLLQMTMISRE